MRWHLRSSVSERNSVIACSQRPDRHSCIPRATHVQTQPERNRGEIKERGGGTYLVTGNIVGDEVAVRGKDHLLKAKGLDGLFLG